MLVGRELHVLVLSIDTGGLLADLCNKGPRYRPNSSVI